MSTSAPALPRPARLRPAGAGERLRGLARGRPGDPRWVRPGLLAVVALAATLCLWHLTINGWSNEYYAAAVKSASVSWKAWFFGSLDPGSFITVDKPPLSLWLMGLSARILGFSSFSVLLPEALCTIGAVGLLYATVRRVFGPAAGLAAAGALAVTPVTVAIGRVDNPDALLVLLLVASAWMLVRALESGRTKHLAWCGAIVGLAFMTKMLQGWMVVPALAAAWLVAGPPGLRVRIRGLAIAGAVMVAVSAAWPLAVSLWPGSTPYIGGSRDGSVWDLILGYNGLGRILGSSAGGQGGAMFGGEPGLWRMLNAQVGGQVAWLLGLAAVGLGAGLWLTRRAPRTDLRRTGFVLFGVWAIVHVVIFSSQQGIFHPYYVSALAPAVAALSGAGVVSLWGWARRSWAGVAVLDLALVGTAVLAVRLLARTPDFAPWLPSAIVVAVAVALLGSVAFRAPGRLARHALAVAAVAGAFAVAAGPAAYSVASLGRSLDGNNVTAGPASATAGPASAAGRMAGPPGGGTGVPAGGMRAASGGMPVASGGDGALVRYLVAHQGSAKYLVAATGSQATASIIVATGKPVVTIGGFNGGDPAPTVSQLAAMVKAGELKYVLLGGQRGPGGGATGIATWVKAHGTAVGGASTSAGTLYAVTA